MLPVLGSLLDGVANLRACGFMGVGLRHGCFPVKFAKFLRAPILRGSPNDCLCGFFLVALCSLFASWGRQFWLGCGGGGFMFLRGLEWGPLGIGCVYFFRLGCCWWFLWELWVNFDLGIKVESSKCALHLPRFILPVSFSDTLLVVSILDLVYDCHL